MSEFKVGDRVRGRLGNWRGDTEEAAITGVITHLPGTAVMALPDEWGVRLDGHDYHDVADDPDGPDHHYMRTWNFVLLEGGI